MNELRQLPSVEQLLQSQTGQEWVAQFGRTLTVEAIQSSLEDSRKLFLRSSTKQRLPDLEMIKKNISGTLSAWTQPGLIPVINATGVILHTNLGRAPLSDSAMECIGGIGNGYSTLEYDLESGERGFRSQVVERMMTRLCGAEAALVVNNNAGAILLVLSSLAKRKSVLIARTQLVEIGGGFRIPDVLSQSGAKLQEVGTTNRVYLSDYEGSLDDGKTLVLRAHHSNYKIVGFTAEPTLVELAELAHKHGCLLVDDLGSGALLDTAAFGLPHEPTVQDSIQAGADIICFSGDKLLGGPQAGIIVGRKDLLDKIKKHPLARALRADKLCLAGLEATLLHYLKNEAIQRIPIWWMIGQTSEQIHKRAKHWVKTLGRGFVKPGRSTIGGGSLPEETLPTFLWMLQTESATAFLLALRKTQPAIIGRIIENAVALDPRTVLPGQEKVLLEILGKVLETFPGDETLEK